MPRGAIAKQVITDKIKEAFGKDFIIEQDKKLYVQAPENGEMVQIAITMTCPKVPVETTGLVSIDGQGFDFTAEPVATTPFKPAEFTEEEKNTINDLMRALNL